MSWPWSELGLPGPAGLPEIRRAYARRLKTTHPEEDPEGFQRLHAAYQEASRQARQAARSGPRPFSGPEGGAPRQRPPEEPVEDGRGSEAPPAREAEEPLEDGEKASGENGSRDWDYDELLKGRDEAPGRDEESEEPEKSKTEDWDYERLFAEGEEEAREARRRKLEELREKNRARCRAQEKEQRRRAADEEESWAAVMAAAHALELLYENGASLPHWQRFLDDPVFLNVRANLDFVFALEDFLEQHPDLSPGIRKAIFTAYEFENGSRYPMYNRLYKLLGVSSKDRRRIARDKSAWRNRWNAFPAWRKACIVICFSILGAVFLLTIGLAVRDACREYTEKRAAEQWETQSLEWLEEDFGRTFVHPLGGHEEICAPAEEPGLYFWITKDGERTENWPGYRTDYPHILLKQALESFAEQWELGLDFDSAGEGYRGEIGEAPAAYLFDLPLLGAGDAITALGALLEDLESRDWYRVMEDKYGGQIIYQVFLCHRELAFYSAISTEDGGFDAEYARTRYETQAGNAFCRYIVENGGLAAKHLGEDGYALVDQGSVEIDEGTFFRVAGLDKTDLEPKVQYLLASGGGMLFCLPEGALERVGGIIDLYRGVPDHLELEGVGLVMVMDQVKTE